MTFTNLYHVIVNQKCKTLLIDSSLEDYVRQTLFPNLPSKDMQGIRVDCLSTEDCYSPEVFLLSDLKSVYDICIIDEPNKVTFTPIYHRCKYIFIRNTEETSISFRSKVFLPFEKRHECYDGDIYINTFRSIVFPTAKLTEFQQIYVRDKPYRFLRMTQKLLELFKYKGGVIVEIGSARKPLHHSLSTLNPVCCNDSHSTYFWCETDFVVHTVDSNPSCRNILENDTRLHESDLHVHTDDGIRYLLIGHDPTEKIRLLFLDAWDVVSTDKEESYAQKHLSAWQAAKPLMTKHCFVLIDDTDIAHGGKGRLVIPQLLQEGFFIVFRGRQTLLFRGPPRKLWATLDAVADQ